MPSLRITIVQQMSLPIVNALYIGSAQNITLHIIIF